MTHGGIGACGIGAYSAIPRTGGCVVGSAEGSYEDGDDGVRRGGAAQQRRPTKRMGRREFGKQIEIRKVKLENREEKTPTHAAHEWGTRW